ncbi:alkaline phosphatase family protein [Mycobacterium sp. NPDC003323]
MGYARYIGRVGALAVTLGVGVALAAAPAASADSTAGSSPSSTSGSSSSASASDGATSSSTGQTSGATSTPSGPAEPASRADAEDDDTASDGDAGDEDSEAGPTIASDAKKTTGRGYTASIREAAGDAGPRRSLLRARVAERPATQEESLQPRVAEDATATVTTATVTAAPAAAATPVDTADPVLRGGAPTETAEIASAGTDEPLVETDPEAPPLEAAVAVAALAAVRDELERNTLRRTMTPQAVTAASVQTKNVLLIGVDGTNLSRVLADPANARFFELIQQSSTAPSSIVGHTTISNPSWSSILTGVWGERTGVINNIFTPWTYDKWPTIFNQLEDHDPTIQTTTIANWDVIAAIAGAGSTPADDIRFIAQVPGDTNWMLTDDAVGDVTESVISGADPNVANFVFSYFVGVDEVGHMYGGASQQYKDALLNFDRNLGEIMEDVAAWEAATGETWTVIMVTDHGHQPQRGLGHGFQSPDETETFVVVRGDGFDAGTVNLQYEIVDVTPTVATLFGVPVRPNSDGTSMTDLDNNVTPIDNDDALRAALQDIIDKNGYPDTITNVALGARTIFASIPYFLGQFVDTVVGGLKNVAGQNIFLVSFLAGAAVGPAEFLGDLGYVVTNFAAQIVARITGVTGASIFPLWPPAEPDITPYDPNQVITMVAVCGDPDAIVAGQCGDGSIAV